MNLNETLLEKLETLSHLHIEASKKAEVIAQLNEILGYVENLNELDTDALDATFSTLKGGTPLRSDIVEKTPHVARDILDRAPESDDDFFIVPSIIE